MAKKNFSIYVMCALCVFGCLFWSCEFEPKTFDQAYVESNKPTEYKITYKVYALGLSTEYVISSKDNMIWTDIDLGSTLYYKNSETETIAFTKLKYATSYSIPTVTGLTSVTSAFDDFFKDAYKYLEKEDIKYKEKVTYLDRPCVIYEYSLYGVGFSYIVDEATGMCLKYSSFVGTTESTLFEVTNFQTSGVIAPSDDFAGMIQAKREEINGRVLGTWKKISGGQELVINDDFTANYDGTEGTWKYAGSDIYIKIGLLEKSVYTNSAGYLFYGTDKFYNVNN